MTAAPAAAAAAGSAGTAPDVGGLLGVALSVIDALGEFGVGLLMALESVVPPVPSEAVLPLAGFLARSGRLSVPVVLVAATIGSLVGAVALYWAGARLGEARLRRWADRVPGTSPADLDRAVGWFDRWGPWAVLLGRCIPLVRSLVSIPAGTSRMPLARFLALTAIGSAVWNTLFVLGGYALGDRWEQIAAISDWLTWAVVAVLAVAVVRWVVRGVRANRARAGDAELPAGADEYSPSGSGTGSR